MMVGGVPPREVSGQDCDRRCPCPGCRFTRPVHCGRVRRAETALRLFTGAGTATVGG